MTVGRSLSSAAFDHRRAGDVARTTNDAGVPSPWVGARREADLPAGGVPREERGVAAAADAALNRVAHLPRPVLVVPDAQVEPVRIERVGTRVEIEAGEEVETNAPRLRPGDEPPLPVVP